MTYVYKCSCCDTELLISKPMLESGREEFCSECDCKTPLVRQYGAGAIKTSDGFKSARK